MSPHWTKILRDVRLARGRVLMIVLALAVSIAAVVTMLSAYTVLAREVPRNYNGTNPASAQLETDQPIDAALLAQIRRRPLFTRSSTSRPRRSLPLATPG